MKNSPHRHKHQLKKALRKNSKLPKSKIHHLQAPNLKVFEVMKRRTENLQPFEAQKAKEIFHAFKKHLEREKHFNSLHVSKRTTPGEVESGPFTIMKHETKHHHEDWKGPCLEKSNTVAHKMLRYQNNPKKAA